MATPQYIIVKAATYPQTSVAHLTADFGATNFIPTLTSFLHTTFPCLPFQPGPIDHFDVFKQVSISTLTNPHLSSQPRRDRIRATPAVQPRGQRAGTPAHFDMALIAKHHGVSGMYTNTYLIMIINEYDACQMFELAKFM